MGIFPITPFTHAINPKANINVLSIIFSIGFSSYNASTANISSMMGAALNIYALSTKESDYFFLYKIQLEIIAIHLSRKQQ